MMNTVVSIVLLQLCGILYVSCYWVKEMENKGAFEGDIMLDPDELETGWNVSRRKYASIKGGRWPGGVVPYEIDSSIGASGISAINQAISNYHQHTCIRWRARNNEQTYVRFYRGSGCSSPVGYRSRRVNYISLATGCWHTGVTMHEMGHTLGFYHEQSRPDRDSNVRIIWNNIYAGMAYNFNKQSYQSVDSLGTPYDFESMMHYGSTAFGIGGRMTIQTINPRNQHLIGNRNGFSKTDIIQLNLMYKCGITEATSPPTTTTTTEAKSSIPPPPECNNKYGYCMQWANGGYCQGKFAKFMALNCCKACVDIAKAKTAPPQTEPPQTAPPKTEPTSCIDDNQYCQSWAQSGECEKNPDWMKVHCRKSCHQC